jgi:hypothetical protein
MKVKTSVQAGAMAGFRLFGGGVQPKPPSED